VLQCIWALTIPEGVQRFPAVSRSYSVNKRRPKIYIGKSQIDVREARLTDPLFSAKYQLQPPTTFAAMH
jgi:hypothetical protein